jgi:hypothetical protein
MKYIGTKNIGENAPPLSRWPIPSFNRYRNAFPKRQQATYHNAYVFDKTCNSARTHILSQ